MGHFDDVYGHTSNVHVVAAKRQGYIVDRAESTPNRTATAEESDNAAPRRLGRRQQSDTRHLRITEYCGPSALRDGE